MSTNLTKTELKYWISFNQINAIGPRRLEKILAVFPNLETAWGARSSDLIQAGIEPKIAGQIAEEKIKINPDLELEKIEKRGIKILTIQDQNYPKLLKEVYAPPPLLYYLGDLNLNNNFPLAVVGSRKISDYGRQVTENLVFDLTKAGLTIISGLAFGVDAVAHEATLKANGKTVGVLGCGLDQIYPIANRELAKKIIANGGAIVSEFPLGMPPLKQNFPQRNRIISGLSLGTLVTQANEKSGALITARFALDQNREVFTVPGNIYQSGCQGPNNLLRLGAKLVTSANDILETLNLQQVKEYIEAKKILPENETEKNILALLKDGPLHIDKLAQGLKFDISILNSTLSLMEIKGMIKNVGSQNYQKL